MNTLRRTKFEIYADILHSIQKAGGRIKKTHIVYKANLTHSRLGSYLDVLIGNGFVVEQKISNGLFYAITDKCVRFLGDMSKLKEISNAFGVPV